MELDLQRFYNINRRILMWIVFFVIVYLLSDFFAVMFLAFLMGFVMLKVARFFVARLRAPYWAAVLFPYLIALTLLVLLSITTVPRVFDEGVEFSKQVPSLLRTLAEEVQKAAVRYNMESVLAKYVGGDDAAASQVSTQPGGPVSTQPLLQTVSPDAIVRRFQATITRFMPTPQGQTNPMSLEQVAVKFAAAVAGGTLKFLLAILLSFLIVLDFDRIKGELYGWRNSTVGGFFHEAASSVVEFSEVVGTAFQCQLVVALLNASITSIGLAVLDIQPQLLLTSLVFLFGLIPVLGVWISSVPIVLIAFNDHDLNRALMAVALITGVHLLEAYVFNPRIYAARFHLNPVVVLIILVLGHELFGVWGMLLGIPVTHYVLNIAQMPSLPKKGRKRPPLPVTPAAPPES